MMASSPKAPKMRTIKSAGLGETLVTASAGWSATKRAMQPVSEAVARVPEGERRSIALATFLAVTFSVKHNQPDVDQPDVCRPDMLDIAASMPAVPPAGDTRPDCPYERHSGVSGSCPVLRVSHGLRCPTRDRRALMGRSRSCPSPDRGEGRSE